MAPVGAKRELDVSKLPLLGAGIRSLPVLLLIACSGLAAAGDEADGEGRWVWFGIS